MKKLSIILLAVVAVMTCSTASAQSKTSYFMEGSYFRTELNPALAPTRGYLALPGMSGIGLNLSNNFVSVDNFFYQRNGEIVSALHNSVSGDEFLGKLPEVNELGINANINILGVGFYAKKMFWQFGVNLRAQANAALDKDIFRAVKTLGNGEYNLDGTSLGLNGYAEAYLGTSFPVCKFVNVGVRAKFLVGMANLDSEFTDIVASVQPDAVKARVRGTLRANAIVVDQRRVYPGEQLTGDVIHVDDMQTLLSNIKSYGGAIDLGTEVRLLDNRLRISAAVVDLGFIKWKPSTSLEAKLKGDAHFNGYDVKEGEISYGSEFDFYTGQLPTEAYTTMLNCSLNVGVEYAILRNHISFGLLSHTEFHSTATISELTASVNLRPTNWLSATVSHTFFNHNTPGILGFALNLHPAGLNVFVGADYLGFNFVKFKNIPIPRDMKSVNIYAGVGFNFGRPKHIKEAERTMNAAYKQQRAEKKAQKRDAKASK